MYRSVAQLLSVTELRLEFVPEYSSTIPNMHQFLDKLAPSTIDEPLNAALPNLRRCEARTEDCFGCYPHRDRYEERERHRSAAFYRCNKKLETALPMLFAHTAPIKDKRWW